MTCTVSGTEKSNPLLTAFAVKQGTSVYCDRVRQKTHSRGQWVRQPSLHGYPFIKIWNTKILTEESEGSDINYENIKKYTEKSNKIENVLACHNITCPDAGAVFSADRL